MAVPPRYSRRPPRRGAGLTPRPADRLPLLIAGMVVLVALIFAGSLLVSALNGFGSSSSATVGERVAVQDGAQPTVPVSATGGTVAGSAPTVGGSPSGTSDAGTSELGAQYVVCLDVGHGGIDWGYTRTDPDTGALVAKESDLNLEVADAIQQRLEAQGVTVVLTRTGDTPVNLSGADVNGDGEKSTDGDGDGVLETPGVDKPNNLDELQARVNVCNDAKADVMVSIHVNGSDNTALQGYEAWWAADRDFSDKNEWLAGELVNQFGEQFADAGFDVQSRGAASDLDTNIPAKDVPANAFDGYVVLAPDKPEREFIGSAMPGAVVEAMFLSNDDDWAVLSDPSGMDAIVKAYVSSINAYFTKFPVAGKRLSTGESHPAHTAGPAAVTTPIGVVDPATSGPSAAGDATPTVYARLPVPPISDLESSYVVQTADTSRKEVALTFDCGADRGYAEDILNLLDDAGIKGSFGMTGAWAEANPDLVLRMAQEGHTIFNHTYSHRSFTGASTGDEDPGSAFRTEELQHTQQVVSDITGGYDMRPYWRPPYGDFGPQTLRDAAASGYGITVMWTVDTLGWNGFSAEQIAQRTMDALQPGEIVLMHVGAQSEDFQAMPAIIEQTEAQGYSFVTIEQLLQP
jgi:peptidoglycan/xylan/chitin deacetylase (PgdA/CDA1 family)/N-acetylmuramoyl-L-alanine amidase